MAENSKWYVLRAVSGKEAKVKEYIEAEMNHDPLLSSHVEEILLPIEKHAALRNGKRVVKDKLSLPGYIFVKATLNGEVAHTLRFTPNVLGFLGGMDNPSPVPQSDINRMLGNVEDTILEEELVVPFIEGETVKVVDGDFNGLKGVIEEINAEKQKLKILVMILGRKCPLELSFMQVEKEA